MKQPISSLEEMVSHVKSIGKKPKVVVACAQDPNTLEAIYQAAQESLIDPILIGDKKKITNLATKKNIPAHSFSIINIESDIHAAAEAVRMTKEDEADILMKGLVGTDIFLKAVMNKETGLLIPGAIMTYVCAIDIPKYHKLLFISDTAVIPYPNLNQKKAMIEYSIQMTKKFGVKIPKISLLGASEKASSYYNYSSDYIAIKKMANNKVFGKCIVDGPLDVFLACDHKSIDIKGIHTPINGDSDILIFPSLESSNSFYKGLMLFGGGELAGLIQGTTKPVIVMSRSESPKSKFYCIALSCLMTD